MKKRLLTLLFTLVLFGPFFAQPGKMSVSSALESPFWFFVDDIRQNETSVHSITVTNIPDGRHHVRVLLDDAENHTFGQQVNINHRGLTMVINKKGSYFGWEPTNPLSHQELTMALNTHPTPMMTEQDFSTALAALASESYDNTRLILAKQIVAQNLMKASQIAEICKLFSFESNRLELAKYAYSHCGEKNRYYLVNASFAYDATKRELDEFIKEQ